MNYFAIFVFFCIVGYASANMNCLLQVDKKDRVRCNANGVRSICMMKGCHYCSNASPRCIEGLACKRTPTILDDCSNGEVITPMQCLAKKCSWCANNKVIKCVKDTPAKPESMKAFLLALILSQMRSRSPKSSSGSVYGVYQDEATLSAPGQYGGYYQGIASLGAPGQYGGYQGIASLDSPGQAGSYEDGSTLDGPVQQITYEFPSMIGRPQGDATLSDGRTYPQGAATLNGDSLYTQGGATLSGDATYQQGSATLSGGDASYPQGAATLSNSGGVPQGEASLSPVQQQQQQQQHGSATLDSGNEVIVRA